MVFPIFPADTNHYGTLFGGQAVAWIDQAAFICATRWCRRKVVTVHLGEINFHHAVLRTGTRGLPCWGLVRTSDNHHIAMRSDVICYAAYSTAIGIMPPPPPSRRKPRLQRDLQMPASPLARGPVHHR
nr:hotdog domain-containing protein [Candidatus Viridilinea mediisalina]